MTRNLGAILPKIVDFIFGRLAGLEDLSHDAIPLFLCCSGIKSRAFILMFFSDKPVSR
jgi:hypothetical protein